MLSVHNRMVRTYILFAKELQAVKRDSHVAPVAMQPWSMTLHE